MPLPKIRQTKFSLAIFRIFINEIIKLAEEHFCPVELLPKLKTILGILVKRSGIIFKDSKVRDESVLLLDLEYLSTRF